MLLGLAFMLVNTSSQLNLFRTGFWLRAALVGDGLHPTVDLRTHSAFQLIGFASGLLRVPAVLVQQVSLILATGFEVMPHCLEASSMRLLTG